MERLGAAKLKVIAQLLRDAPEMEAPLLAWPLVCGSTVADHTRPVEFARGVLRIEVEEKSWREQLIEMAPEYLYGVNRVVRTKVDRIEFVPKATR
jgi:predicted nucleic acid-binding Zn ribbon protein